MSQVMVEPIYTPISFEPMLDFQGKAMIFVGLACFINANFFIYQWHKLRQTGV